MAPNYDETRDEGINTLLSGLSNLLKTEKFTDLTIKLGDRTWRVHRNVVCARSEFFVKACEGEFKEAEEGIVTLHDDEPDAIDKMIYYMYNNAYDDAETEVAPVLFNVRMVAAAEKYFVDHLAHLAISKLNHYVGDAWATQPFADAIEEAYTTLTDSDGQLRGLLLGVAMDHAKEFFEELSPKYSHFQAMAARTPSFSMQITTSLVKMHRINKITRSQSVEAGGPRYLEDTYRCANRRCHVVFRNVEPFTPGRTYTRVCEVCGKDTTRDSVGWDKLRVELGLGLNWW